MRRNRSDYGLIVAIPSTRPADRKVIVGVITLDRKVIEWVISTDQFEHKIADYRTDFGLFDSLA